MVRQKVFGKFEWLIVDKGQSLFLLYSRVNNSFPDGFIGVLPKHHVVNEVEHCSIVEV